MPLGANMLPWLKGKELARLIGWSNISCSTARYAGRRKVSRGCGSGAIRHSVADSLASEFEPRLVSLGALACGISRAAD